MSENNEHILDIYDENSENNLINTLLLPRAAAKHLGRNEAEGGPNAAIREKRKERERERDIER